jgi:hypothetical protein
LQGDAVKPHPTADWLQITLDLQGCGLSLKRISDETFIPYSTVMGYRLLEVEPRWADGQVLITLWRRFMPPDAELPMRQGKLRQRAL